MFHLTLSTSLGAPRRCYSLSCFVLEAWIISYAPPEKGFVLPTVSLLYSQHNITYVDEYVVGPYPFLDLSRVRSLSGRCQVANVCSIRAYRICLESFLLIWIRPVRGSVSVSWLFQVIDWNFDFYPISLRFQDISNLIYWNILLDSQIM